MYEICRLINQVIGKGNTLKRKIVERLGYSKNLNKGFRRLDHLLKTGECYSTLKQKLPEALNLKLEIVEKAFEATHRKKEQNRKRALKQREEYERKTFKPHLWVEHSLPRPNNITIVVFVGIEHWKVCTAPLLSSSV